ncbi:MAG: ACT domain-containing protein [Eubacteriales bacterium]|nr:ACT domain-containing protein [Eubacteriales bacterium]
MDNKNIQINNNILPEEEKFFLVGQKAVPEVLKKVLKVKELLEKGDISIQKAVQTIGISRASYYKYCKDIFPFSHSARGKVVSLDVSCKDKLGFLSILTGIVSKFQCNILTIHQSIPVNGYTNVSLSIEVPMKSDEIIRIAEEIEKIENVKYCKILAMEEK